ncbi:hypothetical protein RvY_13844 [Ramazzottius varieornatus]|uniref:Multidrug resistance-associated protein 1 n=1 Tax=Ramazzottius varieornatus TaxID=947166 RepID=A0A1D1VUI2_RAMVA|nr:hypothetical protein RvY_13844 [Ramazzottius varieornatus]
MAYLGWKRPLEQSDMWDLDPQDKTELHVNRLEKYWGMEMYRMMERSSPDLSTPEAARTARKPYQPSLTKALFKTFWSPLLMGAVLKLANDMVIFIAPQILRLLIGFVSDHSVPSWRGYLYAIVLLLVATAQTIILAQYWHLSMRTGMHVRAAVMAAVYRKALRITAAAKRSSTVGEIVNLMSVDSQRFMDLMAFIHILWSGPLQIALAMYFLWQTLGPSVLAGLAVMVLMIPLNAVIAGWTRALQVSQMKEKDGRIKLMTEILNGIKVLKLYAWEESFAGQINTVRDRELETLKKAAYLSAVTSFTWTVSPFLVALVTFATYVMVDDRNVLDAKKAFVSLSLFNILRFPLAMLPMVITSVVQARVSVDRLSKFFRNEELDPNNVKLLASDDVSTKSSVVISHGSFAWGKEEAVTLKEVNVDVKEGQLVAIVGQVGSGKSSLVAAMLGLMDKLGGEVTLKGSIAYVSQQAWIQNLTLRENILFGRPFDERRYQQVIEACALKQDLAMLPGGDETEIGEKGINLSGGQKQRVSLARAVYGNSDVYFLDDPLSAVDAHVGKHLFDEVIGPNGLLKNKTRILVTHSISFLAKTDVILVLENGTISEMGSYQQLLQAKRAFANFLREHLESDDSVDDSDPEAVAIKQAILGEIGGEPERLGRSISILSTGSLRKAKDVMGRQESASPRKPLISEGSKSVPVEKAGRDKNDGTMKAKKGGLVGSEKAETGKVQWNVYTTYLKHTSYLAGLAVIFFQMASNAVGVGTNFWLGDWADDSEKAERSNSTAWRDYRLTVYGGLGGAQGLFFFFSALIVAYGQVRASRLLHFNMLARILRAPISFFDTTPLGRIVNRFSKDVDTVDTGLPRTLQMWLNAIFTVLSTVIVICVSTPVFGFVIPPLGALYFFVQRFYIATSRQLKRIESVTRSPIYSHFQESVTGTSVIVATKQQSRFILANEQLVDNNNASYYPNMVSQRWLAIRLEGVGNFVTFFAAIFAVVGREYGWGIHPKDIGLSVSYAMTITHILNMMVRMTSELETNVVSVERVKEYTEISTEAEWTIGGSVPSSQWPQNGKVDFDDYQTRYRPGLELVLRGVNANIAAGEKIGIVGRTGAGKSSLTLALFRIIEAAGGKIVIDGVNISAMGLHDLRSRLTIIPQEPVLFSGTLRMNLDPFASSSDEDLWLALENAHLKRFVSSLPNGLQHAVSEGGENLSVGQRQLVCLARALLRKTKILVLDEATAAIDLETDELVQRTIHDKFADCTVLTIAHRLNTIMDSTRIMVLNQGVIVEFDTPSTLLQDKNSVFYGLAKDAGIV